MLEIVLVATGALLGWLTNLWFERRALRATQEENERLQAELSRMQEELHRLRGTLLSLGGQEDARPRSPAGADGALTEELSRRARQTQDPQGRVRVEHLRSHFLARGTARTEFEEALEQMVAAGAAVRSGPWLTIR